jgi:hypothetical protein
MNLVKSGRSPSKPLLQNNINST